MLKASKHSKTSDIPVVTSLIVALLRSLTSWFVKKGVHGQLMEIILTTQEKILREILDYKWNSSAR